MVVSVRHIDLDCKVADHLSLPQLETIIPAQVIQGVLTACEAWEQREQKLKMQAMMSLIIALALEEQCSTREVWRRLMEGLESPVCSSRTTFLQQEPSVNVESLWG